MVRVLPLIATRSSRASTTVTSGEAAGPFSTLSCFRSTAAKTRRSLVCYQFGDFFLQIALTPLLDAGASVDVQLEHAQNLAGSVRVDGGHAGLDALDDLIHDLRGVLKQTDDLCNRDANYNRTDGQS